MRKDDRDSYSDYSTGYEDGTVYFFYRPVSLEAHGPQDIDSIYIVLHPVLSKKYRLLTLDSNKLPSPHDRFNLITGVVSRVESQPEPLKQTLSEHHRQINGVPVLSQTRARACGEGAYTLLERDHQTHLCYALELPPENNVIDSLNINSEGDFIIGVYNPFYGASFDMVDMENLTRKYPFPGDLRDKLGAERIVYQDIDRFLDYEHLRIALFREGETDHAIERNLHPVKKDKRSADIFRDLHLRRSDYSLEPLFNDTWQ